MKPGERIKEIRTAQKLSQREFSRRLGYSSGYLAEIELGKKQPSREFLKKMLEIFSVSSDYILYGSQRLGRAQNLFLEFKTMQDTLKEIKAIPAESITDDEKAILRVLRIINKEDSLSILRELFKKGERKKNDDSMLSGYGPFIESLEVLRNIIQGENWKGGADYEGVLWSLARLIAVATEAERKSNHE